MAAPDQPSINWNNEVQSVSPDASAHTVPGPESLAGKVQAASRHPWGAIDYHLYLAGIERGRDEPTRRNELMFLGTEGFHPIRIDDLHDQRTFALSPTQVITFMNMPILPLSTLDPLTEQKLVLGFDLRRRHILGYFFDSAPDDLADIWYVWHEGQLVIDVHIDRFLELYQFVINGHLEILGTGLFRYFRESKRKLPIGMDLVVVVQFAQFLRDMGDLLWADRRPKSISTEHEEHLRTLLSQASWESWFAARDGLTIQEYRDTMINKAKQVTSCDLLFEAPSGEPCSPPRLITSGSSFSEWLRFVACGFDVGAAAWGSKPCMPGLFHLDLFLCRDFGRGVDSWKEWRIQCRCVKLSILCTKNEDNISAFELFYQRSGGLRWNSNSKSILGSCRLGKL